MSPEQLFSVAAAILCLLSVADIAKDKHGTSHTIFSNDGRQDIGDRKGAARSCGEQPVIGPKGVTVRSFF